MQLDSPIPNILLADDDPDDALLTREALTELGVQGQLICVKDGAELMEYLEDNQGGDAGGTRPDLILLDLNMPRMNGREALVKIKADERFRKIPVVVLSTSRSERDIGSVYDLGGNAYVTKAQSFTGTMAMLESVTNFWLNTAELPANNR
jgi:two-component system response regulator